MEPIKHNVGTCYRCKTVVEPRVSKQWFVKMEPLAKPAVKAVEDGEVKFVPERFDKIYFNWMNNIKDWCISRQLWWGHRIVMIVMKSQYQEKRLMLVANVAAPTFIKTKIPWIHGFLLLCGRFPLWAGRITQKN